MISALIVSHNNVGQLRDGLSRLSELVATGACGEVEILVADNASTDGSPEMVAESFPGVHLLRLDDNLGFGAANNRLAPLARGEHLLLLNPDAWLAEADSLRRLSEALDREPRLALAAPGLAYGDGRPQFVWCPESGVLGEAIQRLRNRFEAAAWNHRLLPPLLRAVLGPGWYSAACLLLRKTAFDEIGGFDEGFFLYFEDVDLSRRLRLAGWRLRSVPGARAYHLKGGSWHDVVPFEYRRAQLRYYRKHRPAWELRFLRRRLRRHLERLGEGTLRSRLEELLEAPESGPGGSRA